MGITKVGRSIQQDANVFKSIYKTVRNLKNHKKTLSVLKAPFQAVGAMGVGATRAAGAMGSAMVNHPRTALIGGGSALYLANKLPKNINAHLSHVDPNQHFTVGSNYRQSIAPYTKDPNLRAQMKLQNRLY